jgi:endogenous inhibitor of DNA gyrase (YacG/DUF329 family)
MTREQEEQIRSLREQGAGYKVIASMTNLSRDVIRYYCKKNNIAGHSEVVKMNIKRMMEDGAVCSYCGKPIVNAKTGRPRRFCTNECRKKWWAKNRDCITKSDEAIYTFECRHCGKEFTAYGNRKRKYCSHSCYIKHRYWNFETKIS